MKQTFMHRPFVNILDMTNHKKRYDTGFVSGVANGYYFMAKVYDEPSGYGINGGRVSKFSLCDSALYNHEKVLANYDRGWDTVHGEAPWLDKQHQDVMEQVLKYLEELPKVFTEAEE